MRLSMKDWQSEWGCQLTEEDEFCGRDRRGWQRRRIMSELMCHVSWLSKMVPRYLLESTVSRASPWRAVDCVRLVQRSFLCLWGICENNKIEKTDAHKIAFICTSMRNIYLPHSCWKVRKGSPPLKVRASSQFLSFVYSRTKMFLWHTRGSVDF